MTFEMYNNFVYICIIRNESKKCERERQKENNVSHSVIFSSQLLVTNHGTYDFKNDV